MVVGLRSLMYSDFLFVAVHQLASTVPKHCRMYLGDMDDKDSEYRSILNRWSD